jgi:hypothetical protein
MLACMSPVDAPHELSRNAVTSYLGGQRLDDLNPFS